MKKKGFTLIELLAVIVILAILALIAIPITIKIISDSRENANKQSILHYAKAVEQDVVNWKTEDTSRQFTDYNKVYRTREGEGYIKVSGDKVVCNKAKVDHKGNLSLLKCYLEKYGEDKSKKYDYIGGKVLESESDESLVYKYAFDIEEDYVDWQAKPDNKDHDYNYYNEGPINNVINNDVVCQGKEITKEGDAHLTNCSLPNSKESEKKVYNYKNGEVTVQENKESNGSNPDSNANNKSYGVGEEITVADEKYRVITDSPSGQEYVTALKEIPLTTNDVNTYGAGHVNMYNANSDQSYYQTAYDSQGFGGMAYYSGTDCEWTSYGYITDIDCTTDYNSSEARYIVDAWSNDKFRKNELTKVDGYTARLIKYDELTSTLGYDNIFECTGGCYYSGSLDNIPDWVYNSNYRYWTMTTNNDINSQMWIVSVQGSLQPAHVTDAQIVVRPVINVKKTAIQ